MQGPTNVGPGNKFFSFCVIGEDTPDLKYKGEKSSLEIGKNNVFREFCKVHRGTEVDLGYTKIGDDNLIMPGVMIAHDCVIGNGNILVDNSALAGHVQLGDHVTLGGYTLIHQFCKLGSYSFTGLSAHITMDVPAFTRVAGTPTKQAGLNTIGLERKGFTKEEIMAADEYAVNLICPFQYEPLGVKDILELTTTLQELEVHWLQKQPLDLTLNDRIQNLSLIHI